MRIDPHVHLRDGDYENHKETLSHGFLTAWKSGLSGVFEMPNTSPPLTSGETVRARIAAADNALDTLGIPLFHGILGGITTEEKQIAEAVSLWKELFPRVAGLKMFAGHSTGNMGIIREEAQAEVYRILARENFTGVLMLHCEKPELLKPELFNPERPGSHLDARPPEAEVESVRDQLNMARDAGFKGKLHICHISVPESLELIEENRARLPFPVSCGITPHHSLLSVDDMKKEDGILLKVNPPLRSEKMRKEMFQALLDERIDWIETDHAPHTLEEKMNFHPSGLPGLQFYSRFIDILKEQGMSSDAANRLTFGNIIEAFDLPAQLFAEPPESRPVSRDEYGFDPFKGY